MLKSATFMIGILLALDAFVGFLLLENFHPPLPAQVVVALRDIPPYTPLDQNMLGTDAQHLNGQLLVTLVQKEELDRYVGGFVKAPILAGERLCKSAIVTAGNPLASKRLALALNDPDRIAAVIPVDVRTSLTQIVTSDYVELVTGMAPGNLTSDNSNRLSEILSGQQSGEFRVRQCSWARELKGEYRLCNLSVVQKPLRTTNRRENAAIYAANTRIFSK